MTNIIYSSCPCCNSKEIKAYNKTKDYTVSNKEFEIFYCKNCTAAFTQNVPNQENIGQYYKSDNYISHSDTQKGFISRVYHKVRNYTLFLKFNLISKYAKSNGTTRQLLDIGAGTGAFANYMNNKGWKVTALEPDEIARTNAKKKYNLDLESPEKLYAMQAESIDAITLWHVLEHIHTLQEYMQQFYKLLNKDGKLFIAVPNYTSYDARYYGNFWAGYDVPRHLYHFSPKSIELLAQKNGFAVVKTKAMWFDSTYVSMLSEQYKTGKQNLIKALLIGILSNMKAIFNSKNCSSVIYVLEKTN